ncbi:MAG: hypothetical protein KAS32_28145 [Candidatus Peribacteraceae bacterium]|nr:hypothetical protein [Candidatus Peribacteraceae bacterium]
MIKPIAEINDQEAFSKYVLETVEKSINEGIKISSEQIVELADSLENTLEEHKINTSTFIEYRQGYCDAIEMFKKLANGMNKKID